MEEVRPDEVSEILRKQLAGFEKEVDIYDVGTVLQIGDGVARVYGLSHAMMSELVEFPHGVFGMVLNLEEDNVGCILFGESHEISEGDTVKRTGRVASMPVGEQMLGRVVTRWASPSTAGDRSGPKRSPRSSGRPSASYSASPSRSLCRPGSKLWTA